MQSIAIKRFLIALGVDESEIQEREGYINAPCPLAPWTHGGGVDSHPSFGIKISNKSRSFYWCFGCSPEAVRLAGLLHRVWLLTGRYPYKAAEILTEHEVYKKNKEKTPEPIDEWADARKKEKPLSGPVLRNYPLLQTASGYEAKRCRDYFRSRGISEQIFNRCGVRYNPHRSTLIYPLTDHSDKIFVLREKSRKTRESWTVSPKLAGFPDMKFSTLRYVGAWFGMGLVLWDKPVMVVEGAEDAMRAASLGFLNTIGSLTASVTDAQIDALLRARVLYLGYDSDVGGSFAHRRITDRIGKRVEIYELNWATAKKKDGNFCKDPGDLPNEDELSFVLSAKKRFLT